VVRLLDYLTGIIALIALPFIAWWGVNQSPQSAQMLEARLQAKALAALQASGMDWAGVEMDGQTAILTGAAPSEDAIVEAAQIVLRSNGPGGVLFGGISQVRTEAGQAPPVRPYAWSAEKTSGGGMVISGHVPSKAVRSLLLLEAEAVAKGPVEDRMVLASGAPAGNWQGIARLAIAQVAKLDTGRAELSDHVLTVQGASSDDALRSQLTNAVTGVAAPFRGVALVRGTPLWSAAWSNGELVLSGAVPSDADRRALVTLARRTSGVEVRDEMIAAESAADGWMDGARAGLAHFAKFTSGIMAFDPAIGAFTFEGEAPASTLQFLSDDMAGAAGRWRVVMAASNQAAAVEVAAVIEPEAQAPADCAGVINAALDRSAIGFEPGSAIFRRADAAALDALASAARSCATGNALELAVEEDVLARARADAMAGFLERAGLPRPRIAVIGYGPAEGGRGMDTGAASPSDRPREFTVREQSAQWPG